MKHLFRKLVCAVLCLSLVMSFALPGMAAAPTHTATLYAQVTDSGEIISKMVIDFGESLKVSGVDTDTFTVHAVGSTAEHCAAAGAMSYGDYDADRVIEKVEANGRYLTLYFNLSDGAGATLAYLSNSRNYPVTLSYTITQNKPLTATALDGREMSYTANYAWDGQVHDEETAKFESVKVEGGINYQLYNAGDADSLSVWFHGNGEGDSAASQNNVAQMLANRGTVAWATDEAQQIFGGAYVMAFQAPDTWYYAQRDGLLAQAEAEIQQVIAQYGIDPEKVYVSGCSAGGYMTTRMLIAYPDLFKAAMINCPALDVAQLRGGETPTDEELASLRDSDTAIWLVQAVTDSSVRREDCSQRMFDILTQGQKLTQTSYAQDLDSDFITWETADNKYKLSLYETVNLADKADSFGVTRPMGNIKVASDDNQDGVYKTALKNDHWSWIFTLNNDPQDASGTDIWTWAANYTPNRSLVQQVINGWQNFLAALGL